MSIVHSNPATVPPPPNNNYTHAIRVDMGTEAMVFVSGQIALGPDGEVVGVGDVARQSEEVFELLSRILAAHGADFTNVVSIRTFLTDMGRLREYGAVRRRYVTEEPPTSTTVEVSKLFHPDALLEVEVVAVVPS